MSRSNYTNAIRKTRRIVTIIGALGQYQSYFPKEMYPWVNPSDLQEKIAGAEEFFSQREQLDGEVDNLTLSVREKRADLEKMVRTAKYLMRGYYTFYKLSVPEVEVDYKDVRDASTKGEVALQHLQDIQDRIVNMPFTFLNLDALKSELEDAKNSYEGEKVKYDHAKESLDSKKVEFLDKEDDIDDLYHQLVNVIEGVLHEHRHILLQLMPWRERKS